MDIEEYRILHSQIIEQYQLVEYHLEGLIALMESDGYNFLQFAKRVENDAMGELIRKAKFLVKELKFSSLIPSELFDDLSIIRDDRNFYCHECFLINKSKNYETKKSRVIEDDLKLVIKVNDSLTKAFESIRNYRNLRK